MQTVKTKFVAAGEVFEFNMAANLFNVSVPDYDGLEVTLPKGYLNKLKRVQKDNFTGVEKAIHSAAVEECGALFRDYVMDKVRELGLRSAFTWGERGTALCMYSDSSLLQLCACVERTCAHCTDSYAQHAGGKCLTLPTAWATTATETLRELRALRTLSECTRTDSATESARLLAEIKGQIDLWLEGAKSDPPRAGKHQSP